MGVGIAELRESLGDYAARFDAAVLSAAQAADVVEQASRIEKIMAALDPIREEIFHQARSAARHEPPDAYAADALAEMARRSWGAETSAMAGAGAGAGDTGAVKGAVVGALRAAQDDETHTSDNAGGQPDSTGAGGTATPGRGPRRKARRAGAHKVIVRVDRGTMLRGYPIEGEVCEIAGFGPVAVSAVGDMIDSDDPVPRRGGHPGPEAGGGGPSGAAAQRLAADGPAVALPELCQPGDGATAAAAGALLMAGHQSLPPTGAVIGLRRHDRRRDKPGRWIGGWGGRRWMWR